MGALSRQLGCGFARTAGMKATLTTLAAAIAGCSMFNPYQHMAVVPRAAEGAMTQLEALKVLGFEDAKRLAGGAYEAISELESMRLALYNDMRGMAIARSTTAAVGVVSSTWAAYNALKVTLSTGAAGFTDSDRERAGRLALVAGTSYALGEFFVNPAQENIYAEGYNALTCLALQSRPLMMAAGDANQPYEQHRAALAALDAAVTELNKEVAKLSTGVARAGEAGASTGLATNPSARELVAARRALALARDTLRNGHAVKDLIDKSGFAIRGRAALIIGAINSQLRDKAAAFKDVKATLDQAKSITNAFKGLVDDAPPPTEEADSASSGAAQDDALRTALAAWPMPMMSGVHLFASAVGVVAATKAGPAASASAPAATRPQAAASAASAPKPSEKAPAKKPAPLKPPPEPTATQAQLADAVATLKDFIVDAEAQKKHLLKMQQDAKSKEELEKLKAELEVAATNLQAMQKKLDTKFGSCIADDGSACARTKLAIGVEDLFAKRRVVQYTVNNFRTLTSGVRSVAECNTNPAGLRIFPSEGRRVRQGDSLSFTVSEASGATPFVVLQGNAGTPPAGKESLKVESLGAVTRITLLVGANAPEGHVLLVATDSKARHSETVRLYVEKAQANPNKNAEIAAAAAAAAKSAAEAAKSAAEAAALAAK